VPYTFTAVDLAGNPATVSGSLTVTPVVDPNAPVVAISCPANGDGCAPGVGVTVSFSLSDPDRVDFYRVLVDGVPGSPVTVNATSFQGQVVFTPPAGDPAGAEHLVRIEATDLAGNVGHTQVRLVTVTGVVLSGTQTISTSHSGEALVLAAGTYTATVPLEPGSLTLLQGASLVAPALQPLRVNVAGDLDVGCGASMDVSGRGYGGA
jgi:hypothetical protein